ncbi:DUF6624 domain-containing protein [Macellibacteroides fermentans]|uniref:Uncharacterized protein n=1 Tax=Parabacteroides chartae TaxID=1037355 RepID=A0A1T5F5Y2_9BACT|nr:DUF6624 domain-containing protein [Parabacteroides chartae]SKB91584.1 hypothetical protein SAMN05660349_03304 [Parabacteroides chartae]
MKSKPMQIIIVFVFSLSVCLFSSSSYQFIDNNATDVINPKYNRLIDSAYFYSNNNDSLTLSFFLKAFAEEHPQNPYTLWDVSVIASRLKKKEMAFDFLKLSVEKGYSYYNHMIKNKSLVLLDSVLFNQCLQKVRLRDSLLNHISITLDSIFDLDQGIRNVFHEEVILKGKDKTSMDAKMILDSMRFIDSTNLITVKSLMRDHGFIGRSLRTAKSQQVMYLIFLHAPVEEIENNLAIFKNAVKSGELPSQQYPYFEDRILANRRGVQKYGTQCFLQSGEVVLVPLIDSLNVNKYRKEFGLETIEEYIKMLKSD